MALARTAQAPQASASNAAAATTTGSSFAINYGVSGVATIINGGTGPTIGCDFVLQVSNDGGSTWFEWSRQTAGTTNGATYAMPFALGVCGLGGDFGHYRTVFTGNTAQTVTVQADAETTTGL
jgi:hypothetical protein